MYVAYVFVHVLNKKKHAFLVISFKFKFFYDFICLFYMSFFNFENSVSCLELTNFKIFERKGSKTSDEDSLWVQ